MKLTEIVEGIQTADSNYIVLTTEPENINSHDKVLVKHKICGYEYPVSFNKFLMGRRCPKCSGKIKGTTENFKKAVYNLVGNEYTVLGEYVNRETPIKMLHESGEIIEAKPYLFLKGMNRSKNDKSIIE